MEAGFDFLKREYPNQEGFNLTEVLITIMAKKEEFQYNNHVKRGYKYLLDTMDEFLKKPERIWQVLEEEKDKKVFFEYYDSTFTMDKKENFKSLSMDLIHILVSYSPLFVHLDRVPNEYRNTCLKTLQRKIKNERKPSMEKEQREALLRALKSMFGELKYFTDLVEVEKLHNSKMQKAGLDFLCVDENIPPIDNDGKIFGYNLEKCDTFQLMALYAFYTNRLEKIEENLGKGFFFLYNFTMHDKLTEREIFKLNTKNLKEAWKKFYVLSKIFDSKSRELSESEPVDSEDSYEKLTINDVYDSVYKGLEEDYAKTFNGADLSEDASVFMTTNGFSKRNYYMLKDGILEEVLLYAIENNVNWGFIEDEDGRLLKKLIIIGIDVPGLNMPLRLHYPLENLRAFVKQYLETTEIPMYIGNEDFVPYGSNVGTQLLLPIDAKDKDRIRKASKGKKFDEKNGMLKHIECIQWPNQIKKLLTEKTNKTQVAPDYIDIFNGKKRISPRREEIQKKEK